MVLDEEPGDVVLSASDEHRHLLRHRFGVEAVDLAGVGCLDHHDAHACHHCRCSVGAVRRTRDQANVALLIAIGVVVAANGKQAGQFAL